MLEFIKKYRLIFALVILFLPWALYGINTLSEGYQSTPSSNTTINAASRSDYCRKINNASGDTYFVPTNTASEWSSFLSNLPPSTTAAQCCDAGQCLKTSDGSCITADADSDVHNTTTCLSTNNGGGDCRDDLASVYDGATPSCNSYADDNCSGSTADENSKDIWDGAVAITTDPALITYYSGADCTGSVVAKSIWYGGWDKTCGTAAVSGGASGYIELSAANFGIAGNCYNQWNFINMLGGGNVSYNSRDYGGCANESSSIGANVPNTAYLNPPGNSCSCTSDGSAYTNWTCP